MLWNDTSVKPTQDRDVILVEDGVLLKGTGPEAISVETERWAYLRDFIHEADKLAENYKELVTLAMKVAATDWHYPQGEALGKRAIEVLIKIGELQ